MPPPEIEQDRAEALLKEFTASTDSRRNWAQALLNYYYGDVEEDIKAQLSKIFDKKDNKLFIHLNLLRKFADLKAQVFDKDPEIEIKGSESDQKLWEELALRGSWMDKLRTASAWEKVLHTFHVRVFPEGDHLGLDLISPAITEVLPDEKDPTQPGSILYQISTSAEAVEEEKNRHREFAYWSDDHHFIIDSKGMIKIPDENNPDGTNPYGRLPILKVDEEIPETDSYWLPGVRDILMVNRAIDVMAIAMGHAEVNQGFTQLLAVNVDAAILKNRGADAIWTAKANAEDPKPEIIPVQLKGDLEEMSGAIRFLIEMAVLMRNLPPQEFRVDAAAESGFAKMIGRLPLLEERQRDVPKWTSRLQDLFEIIKVVWNTSRTTEGFESDLANTEFSENAEISVNFADPEFPQSELEELEVIQKKVDMGMMNRIEAIQKEDPDLDDEEAAAKLKENAAVNQEFTSANLLSQLGVDVRRIEQ